MGERQGSRQKSHGRSGDESRLRFGFDAGGGGSSAVQVGPAQLCLGVRGFEVPPGTSIRQEIRY
jgi:hypothetical protein